MESDAVVQTTALQLGVPLTVVNPSTVIGDSVTGESDQVLGLATTVLDLIDGKLRAVPGGSLTFVPVVTVDYLARFIALLPTLEEARGMSYWVLDDDTPALPVLLRLVAGHHKVKVPRVRLPVCVIKFLPVALTQADPETLSFLSTDRYPTGPAQDLARAHGLEHADVVVSLQRWSDHLTERGHITDASPPVALSEPRYPLKIPNLSNKWSRNVCPSQTTRNHSDDHSRPA